MAQGKSVQQDDGAIPPSFRKTQMHGKTSPTLPYARGAGDAVRLESLTYAGTVRRLERLTYAGVVRLERLTYAGAVRLESLTYVRVTRPF
jgi:hypothetical protein